MFLYSIIGRYSKQKPKGEYFRFYDGLPMTNIRVITLVGEDWLHWLIDLAGIFCLCLSTCVDEMGWGDLVTVPYSTYWSQMREGMQGHS